ncbi:prolipoprotein diacylglyceryl transferase [Phaeovibrio sulfidiphilus]|uniref:Phosphatidylglycerol--prolipoprotein diacylglyceryl transferase n=1 Tax=Phaeovibrio sulfidiphilus TaxID=1220600 RepID=A0A8J6YKC1_9PROT|nr:prolipoprotein diacylglyceryl transferase [Phaeovibrio sulfidiphilus]MBE1236085.1 prolipoprotein diacylglyceryl transferase [Phaeovibrio sulfidiphilus]
MTLAIPFPAIDPVLLQVGPVAIRWYALAYVAGLLFGWWYLRALCRRSSPPIMDDRQTEDLLVWVTLGVILGGRLGYVLFYNTTWYLQNPLDVIKVWEGGMSFHGGVLGVIGALWLFSRRTGTRFLRMADAVVTVAPLGLFLGRLANFVNGELFGRVATDVPWAVIFPGGGPEPRHPSQIYEAFSEGLLLLVLLGLLWRFTGLSRRPGAMTGVFLMGYGTARTVCELFREPDAQIGFLEAGLTMGQVLSVPLILAGLVFLVMALRRPPVSAGTGTNAPARGRAS